MKLGKRHKHNYRVISVERAARRGYVIVKYRCINRSSYCPEPYKIKRELEKT
jgi:hypothetical protein